MGLFPLTSSSLLGLTFVKASLVGLVFCFLSYSGSGQNYQTGINTVPELGTTFVDADTAGGPWALLGYGSNGRLGSLLTAEGGTFSGVALDGQGLVSVTVSSRKFRFGFIS